MTPRDEDAALRMMHTTPRVTPSNLAVSARLDSRGRLNLKPFEPVSDSFLVDIDDDGVITLTPLWVMTVKAARELESLRHRRDDAQTAAAQEPLGESTPEAGG